MDRTSRGWKLLASAAAFGLVCGALALPGCAPYANYPARGEDDPAINDPNIIPAPDVIEVSLARVLKSWPVEGDFVINLPQGMSRRRAEEVLRRLDNPHAHLVSLETSGLPAYHVTRVWIRPGARAQVEILRPVFGIGGRDEAALFQPVTVKLRRSPIEAWQIDAVRVWPIGQAEVPELYGWPEPGQAPAAPAKDQDR
jgi:hypothetical protein